MNIPCLETERTFITLLLPADAQLMVRYVCENERHFRPWEPLKNRSYFSHRGARARIETMFDLYMAGRAFHFVGLNKDRTEIIGVCNFTNIVRGAFCACYLGYSIAQKFEGKGLMFEMLQKSIDYIFLEAKLHRIMANYVPHNTRSESLLTRLGFEREGLARSYLKIAGKWEDHVLTSKINPHSTDI